MISGLKLFIVLLVVTLLVGCASLTDRTRNQFVYIRSEPPGATIIDNERVLGTTPGLIRIRKQKNYHLQLQRANESKVVELPTVYAWKESLLKNLFLGGLAPFALLTDYLSGSAWNYQDPEPIPFSQGSSIKLKTFRLLLAPPLAEEFRLSDEVAHYWEKQLPKLYPNTSLVPYQESLAHFQSAGYDFDQRSTELQEQRRVLYEMNADQIFFSEIRGLGVESIIYGDLIDPLGNRLDSKSSGKSIVTAGTLKSSLSDYMPSWFTFIPNTVGVDFADTHISLSDAIKTHESVESQKRSELLSTLTYLQALTLSRQAIPRANNSALWKIQFVPSATLAYKKIFFPDFEKLAYVDFNFLQFGVGIGLETGLQLNKHYFYFRYIPLFTVSKIDWDQPGGQSESMTSNEVAVQADLGYLWFFTDQMSVRFFTKSIGSGHKIWNSVTHKVNPTTPELEFVNNNYTGISFGYTFDTRDRLVIK